MFASAESALTSVGSLTLGSPIVLGIAGGVAALFAVMFAVRMWRNRKGSSAVKLPGLLSGVTSKMGTLASDPLAHDIMARIAVAIHARITQAIDAELVSIVPGLAPVLTPIANKLIDAGASQLEGQLGIGQTPAQPSTVTIPPGHDVIAVPKDHPILEFLRSALEARSKSGNAA